MGSKSESRDFAIGVTLTAMLAVGFVAYARWIDPISPARAATKISSAVGSRFPTSPDARGLSKPETPVVIANVYECDDDSGKVFSDRPCSEGAQLREVAAPNGMRAFAYSAEPRAEGAATTRRDVVGAGKATEVPHSDHQVCKSIEQQIDSINARMRHGYSSREGEWYRERLRKLSDLRWEAKCRFH